MHLRGGCLVLGLYGEHLLNVCTLAHEESDKESTVRKKTKSSHWNDVNNQQREHYLIIQIGKKELSTLLGWTNCAEENCWIPTGSSENQSGSAYKYWPTLRGNKP